MATPRSNSSFGLLTRLAPTLGSPPGSPAYQKDSQHLLAPLGARPRGLARPDVQSDDQGAVAVGAHPRPTRPNFAALPGTQEHSSVDEPVATRRVMRRLVLSTGRRRALFTARSSGAAQTTGRRLTDAHERQAPAPPRCSGAGGRVGDLHLEINMSAPAGNLPPRSHSRARQLAVSSRRDAGRRWGWRASAGR